MNFKTSSFLKAYGFSLILITSIILGSLLGIIYKKDAIVFKPFGDIFLNLLFTSVVPLVFFSISSVVASMTDIRRLGKIISAMILVFFATGLIASVIMAVGVVLYPPAVGVKITLEAGVNPEHLKATDQIVKAFTASDFTDILSKKNMLALIIFSILLGLATSAVGTRGKVFASFLVSASDVMMKLFSFIMYYAPIGLCAYFAYLVGVFGPELLGAYARAMVLYYPTAIMYFFFAFTLYAYIAAKGEGARRFWRNIIPASLTALATGSSMATIPANLEAANKRDIIKSCV